VVLTIHDVSYERHPEWYPYRRDWLRRAFYRRCATRASHVVTVSAFSAGEIAAAYRIDANRISVTPLGVDDAFVSTGVKEAAALPSPVTAPYVLHVGDLHARRNLLLLLAAVVSLNRTREGSEPVKLVLVGTDRGVRDRIEAAARQAGMPEMLVHFDHVAEATLALLYRHAVALVYPSLYEGFGLPLIEAMASGTPVIAARTASIPEVTGDAAILLDPSNQEDWTAAVGRLIADPVEAGRLRAAGLNRARQFTWTRTAWLTLEAYRRVA
jgi:alpha-1,3-rhamnosyl/mannosyltransferase